MKKAVYLFSALFGVQQLHAQVPEDALRMSWNVPSGTARCQAIGGAMGSLGGDITTVFVNPAGLGAFKTGEFVFSPQFTFHNEKSTYLGSTSNAESLSKFNIGTTGIIWSSPNYRNPMWKNSSGSFAINRTADFNSRTYYKGVNTVSSFSEAFAEEFAQSGLPIDVQHLSDQPLTLGTKLANYTYLIDTLTTGGGVRVAGLPERDPLLHGTAMNLLQERDIETSGGITELAFAYASNYNDKVYIGGSIGVPIMRYSRTATISESDLSGSATNNFVSAKYREDYKSSGVGINAKLGVIVRPAANVRAGLAVTTPTVFGLKETTTGRMDVNDKVYGLSSATAATIYTANDVAIPEYKYDLTTPWKFLVSGSYVFGGVEDVKSQKGFITADVEYVTYRSSRFRSANEDDDADYYNSVNQALKASYKGAFNARIGGELKFNTLMARLGFAYYGNPYDDPALKANHTNVSGGLGYRNGGIFVDVTVVEALTRDVNFPYRLADKPNVFADTRYSDTRLLLTFGVKF